MNRFRKALSNRWGAYSIAAVIGVVTYFILSNLPNALAWISRVVNLMSPIIIGIVIAYLIDLIVVFFENKVFRRIKKTKVRFILSVVVSILLVLILISLFVWLVLPHVVSSITHFVSNAQNYSSLLDDYLARLDEFAAEYGFQLNATKWTANIHEWTDKSIEYFTTNLSLAMDTVLLVGSMLVNVFVGIILAIYFLAGKKKLYSGIRRFRHALLTDEQYEKHTEFLKRSSAIFAKYISYTILEAIGVGLINALFMLIVGLPNVTLISVVVGVTNILPTFGPIIGGAIGAFILLLEDPMYMLIFIIFTLILQTIDGYIVKPHLFGDSLGMPSFVSLISIIVGGKLFGAIGILISIPFAAVCAILYRESFLPWLVKRKQAREQQAKAVLVQKKKEEQ